MQHCLHLSFYGNFTVRLPPRIVRGPDMHYTFRDDGRIDMICVATASVDVTYVCFFCRSLHVSPH